MVIFNDVYEQEERVLSDQERVDWMRLIRIENIGPIIFHELHKHFGTISAVLEVLPEMIRRGGGKKSVNIVTKTQAEEEIAYYHKIGARVVAMCEPDYPMLLKTVKDCPPILTVLGHTVLLRQRKVVAIVGTRKATFNGLKFTNLLAEELGKLGYTIISGLALGIDGAAHISALKYGTAAFLAGSIDQMYPPQHKALYHQIKEAGLLLSEGTYNTPLSRKQFPIRNRLISGASLGVIVVEATPNSGALSTARFGLEQGREIFAVPGSPLEPRAQGGNNLIKQGATLIQSVADVNDVLDVMSTPQISERWYIPKPTVVPSMNVGGADIEKAHQHLEKCIAFEPVDVDEIIRLSDFPAPVILAALIEMEIAGKIERHLGNRVSLVA